MLVEARLPASGRFAIEYRHSYYRVPAREEFAAGESGFRMVGVGSPNEAVLDYYELAGTKDAGSLDRLTAAHPRHLSACR